MQKGQRFHRDSLIENVSNQLHALSKNCPLESINFRELFELGLFGLALKQVSLINYGQCTLSCNFTNGSHLGFADFGRGCGVHLCG